MTAPRTGGLCSARLLDRIEDFIIYEHVVERIFDAAELFSCCDIDVSDKIEVRFQALDVLLRTSVYLILQEQERPLSLRSLQFYDTEGAKIDMTSLRNLRISYFSLHLFNLSST